jgi:hypothetical protein
MIGNPFGPPWPSQDGRSPELPELSVRGEGSKEHGVAFLDGGRRVDSFVSTCAGPTPGPEDRAATPAHDRAGTPGWPHSDSFDAASFDGGSIGGVAPPPIMSPVPRPTARQVQETEIIDEGRPSLPAQVRKIFVGGIPQSMTQEDFGAVFSQYGRVKRAWLQRHRATDRTAGGGGGTAQRNHRGFGFVIFHDSSAVERLLGGGSSRFITLPDGRRLEVKRAVSSTDMAAPTTSTAGPQRQWSQRGPPPPEPKNAGGSGGHRPNDLLWPGSDSMTCRPDAIQPQVAAQMALPTPVPSTSLMAPTMAMPNMSNGSTWQGVAGMAGAIPAQGLPQGLPPGVWVTGATQVPHQATGLLVPATALQLVQQQQQGRAGNPLASRAPLNSACGAPMQLGHPPQAILAPPGAALGQPMGITQQPMWMPRAAVPSTPYMAQMSGAPA